jgi:hypothetical protein
MGVSWTDRLQFKSFMIEMEACVSRSAQGRRASWLKSSALGGIGEKCEEEMVKECLRRRRVVWNAPMHFPQISRCDSLSHDWQGRDSAR